MSIAIESVSNWEAGLVDLMVASGSLAPDDAQRALADAAGEGSLVLLLAERGLVDTTTSLRCLARLAGLVAVDFEADPPEEAALLALPADLGEQLRVVGYAREEGRIVLASAEPLEDEQLAIIEAGIDEAIGRCVLADARAIATALVERRARGEHEHAPAATSQGDTEEMAPHPSEPLALAVEDEPQGLDGLLRVALAAGASDLHLSAGFPPAIRVDGAIRSVTSSGPLEASAVREMVYAILAPEQRARFEKDLELDTAYWLPGEGRFRVSVFQQRGHLGAVLRLIPNDIPCFAQLGLPASLASLAELRRGLVLVTGVTGSGKSTTLASIVDLINQRKPLHIMTVEDPIEYAHVHRASIVNQREVGLDTRSFADALRHVLRQDPDVILVGEMRDLETIAIALTAAETGHLVLSTLHTPDAPQTIDRIIDVFPPTQQPQIRIQLASALEAVVSQQLVIAKSGVGRVPIVEVMVCSPGVRNLIRTGKTHQLSSLIQSGGDLGMQTMDFGLARAVQQGLISELVAFERAHDPDELRDYLQH